MTTVPFRVITFNANGIRSAAKKGFFDWANKQNADVICIQELKAQAADMMQDHLMLAGYKTYFHCAEKKGYSGVGIYTKHSAKTVMQGLGFALADTEGRHIMIQIGALKIASAYLPSGTSGDERQQCKFDFLAQYQTLLSQWKNTGSHIIICGDFNIAHRAIDLKNWRGNQKNSGFLPEERAWMDQLFDSIGYIDSFRSINAGAEQYTWWSNRGRAWEKNVGWRIDYQIVTQNLKNCAQKTSIYKDERFSDHAPLIIDYLLPAQLIRPASDPGHD